MKQLTISILTVSSNSSPFPSRQWRTTPPKRAEDRVAQYFRERENDRGVPKIIIFMKFDQYTRTYTHIRHLLQTHCLVTIQKWFVSRKCASLVYNNSCMVTGKSEHFIPLTCAVSWCDVLIALLKYLLEYLVDGLWEVNPTVSKRHTILKKIRKRKVLRTTWISIPMRI